MDELLARAITAYYRTRPAGDARQPDGLSARLTHLGKAYVVLKAAGELAPLAVYRCMNRGELKRLKRWPADLLPQSTAAVQAPSLPAMPVLLDLVPLPSKEVRQGARKQETNPQPDADPQQAGLF